MGVRLIVLICVVYGLADGWRLLCVDVVCRLVFVVCVSCFCCDRILM